MFLMSILHREKIKKIFLEYLTGCLTFKLYMEVTISLNSGNLIVVVCAGLGYSKFLQRWQTNSILFKLITGTGLVWPTEKFKVILNIFSNNIPETRVKNGCHKEWTSYYKPQLFGKWIQKCQRGVQWSLFWHHYNEAQSW